MSASESENEIEIDGLAEDKDYLDYINFNSPELQEFYNFYDAGKRIVSSEIVVFPRDKLAELHEIFYPKAINAYQRYSREIQSIQQLLRDVSHPEDEEDNSILEPLKLRIQDCKQKMNALIPCLHELKNNLEERFKEDQNFKALLAAWKNAPRELRRIELSPQALAALQSAPRGAYATFQPSDDEASVELSPPSSPRLGQ